MELHLLFTDTIILEDSSEMKLEYSLTEKCSQEDEQNTCYGIQVLKHLDESVEKEIVPVISYSKENVIKLLSTLFNHKVTPMTLLGTLDDLMTEHEILN